MNKGDLAIAWSAMALCGLTGWLSVSREPLVSPEPRATQAERVVVSDEKDPVAEAVAPPTAIDAHLRLLAEPAFTRESAAARLRELRRSGMPDDLVRSLMVDGWRECLQRDGAATVSYAGIVDGVPFDFREILLETRLQAMAEVSPDGFRAELDALSPSLRRTIGTEALGGLAERDPAAALAMARRLNADGARIDDEKIFTELAKRDPAMALEEADREPGAAAKLRRQSAALKGWILTDYEGYLRRAEQPGAEPLPLVDLQGSGYLVEDREIVGITHAIAAAGRGGSMYTARRLFTESGARMVGHHLMEAAADRDPASAFASLKRYVARPEIPGTLAISLARGYVAAAGRQWSAETKRDLLELLNLPSLRMGSWQFIDAFADAASGLSGEAGLAIATELAGSGGDREFAVGLATTTLARRWEFPETVIAEIPQEFRPAERDRIVEQILSVGVRSPDERIGLVHELSDPTKRATMAEKLVQEWAGNDPQAALAWAAGHAGEYPGAVKSALQGWFYVDSRSVSELVNSLPPGPQKDNIVPVIAEGISLSDPDLAAAWALSAASDDAVDRAIRGIARVNEDSGISMEKFLGKAAVDAAGQRRIREVWQSVLNADGSVRYDSER